MTRVRLECVSKATFLIGPPDGDKVPLKLTSFFLCSSHLHLSQHSNTDCLSEATHTLVNGEEYCIIRWCGTYSCANDKMRLLCTTHQTKVTLRLIQRQQRSKTGGRLTKQKVMFNPQKLTHILFHHILEPEPFQYGSLAKDQRKRNTAKDLTEREREEQGACVGKGDRVYKEKRVRQKEKGRRDVFSRVAGVGGVVHKRT